MRRLLLAAALCVPTTASAHFRLDAPASQYTQSASYGDPQKNEPRGPVAEGGTETNKLTTVQSGGKLTLTITETIMHPGHYRVAIAQNEAGLPPAPPVTKVGNDACGSVPIDMNPQLPLLADGIFAHTTKFTGPQTAEIQLPGGYTCDNCVVQVVEYMSNHAAPCFYYHCAKVSVTNGPASDAGVDPTDPGSSDSGCSTTGKGASPALLLLALVALRRRRSR